MQSFLANPYVARILGAVGAGTVAYLSGQTSSVKGAALVSLSFLGYSAVHTASASAAK